MVDDALERVLERLSDELPQLIQEVVEHVHRQQDSYSIVSAEQLAVSVSRNLRTSQKALRQLRAPGADDLEEAMETVRERYAVGIPMEELIRAFALCVWRIHQAFLEVCAELGTPNDIVMEGSNVLWSVGDAFTTRVVMGYHDLTVHASLQDAQRRAAFVRNLLAGALAPADLAGHLLDPNACYAAVRCLMPDGFTDLERHRLESTGSLPGAPAMLAISGDECLGIVAQQPQPSPETLVGIGGYGSLVDIRSSFDIAERVCHVANHLGRRGVQSLNDLTWRVAAVDRPEVTQTLRALFLDPLRAEGVFGADLEASVRSFLAHGQSIPKAAAHLVLHVNSLRYRLHRFSDLTGAQLDDVNDLLDVTWAFELGDLPPLPRSL